MADGSSRTSLCARIRNQTPTTLPSGSTSVLRGITKMMTSRASLCVSTRHRLTGMARSFSSRGDRLDEAGKRLRKRTNNLPGF